MGRTGTISEAVTLRQYDTKRTTHSAATPSNTIP